MVWRSSHGATVPHSKAEKSVQDEQGISQFSTATTTSHFVCVIEEECLDFSCHMVLDFVNSNRLHWLDKTASTDFIHTFTFIHTSLHGADLTGLSLGRIIISSTGNIWADLGVCLRGPWPPLFP